MAKANSFEHISISAVKMLARLAAKKAVQAQLRDQGVRVTTYPYAELMLQAGRGFGCHRTKLRCQPFDHIEACVMKCARRHGAAEPSGPSPRPDRTKEEEEVRSWIALFWRAGQSRVVQSRARLILEDNSFLAHRTPQFDRDNDGPNLTGVRGTGKRSGPSSRKRRTGPFLATSMLALFDI